MIDFITSHAGQFAIVAKQFLLAAATLSDAPANHRKMLFRPTLANTGQGLELLLKASLFLNGQTKQIKGRKGHDILKLWRADECKLIRCCVYENALNSARFDRANSKYLGIPEDKDVISIVEEHIVFLCELHSSKFGYPLRYPSDEVNEGPRTPLLVKSLLATADDFLKRPNQFRSDFSGI